MQLAYAWKAFDRAVVVLVEADAAGFAPAELQPASSNTAPRPTTKTAPVTRGVLDLLGARSVRVVSSDILLFASPASLAAADTARTFPECSTGALNEA
jgi:hypothetical protein